MIDLMIHACMFNFEETPSDFLRMVVHSKGQISDYKNKFDRIYARSRAYYRQRDQKREAELEAKRLKKVEKERLKGATDGAYNKVVPTE